MTGQQLKDLNTEIRGGREMDDTTFYVLLNLAKAGFERMRPWRKLITKDASKSSTSATTYATAFALPSGFIMPLQKRSLVLISASNPLDFKEYVEVPMNRWDEYKNSQGYFMIDHKNSNYYVSGTVNGTYTHNLYHIATSTTLSSSASWVFPEEFHPALAFDVAARDELGMDYDDINARQGNANLALAQTVMRSAIKWDDALQRSALGA